VGRVASVTDSEIVSMWELSECVVWGV
jgi:hypothetical protein